MSEPQVWGFPKDIATRLLKSLEETPGGTIAHPRGRYFEDSPSPPILLRNDANEAMPAYGIGRVTGYASVNGADCLTVAKPTTTFGTFVVNGPSEIAATGTGNNCGSGSFGPLVRVKYHSGDSPAVGDVYEVSGWELKSQGYPLVAASILGVIDSTNKLCFAHLMPTTRIWFKAPSGGIDAISSATPGSATCDVYRMDPSTAALEDTGIDVTVYNFASLDICDGTNRYGQAILIGKYWSAVSEDCND